MTDDKKRELFPYFAYIYSQQLNPERYGQVESIEDWTNLIQSNQADIEKITQAAEQLSDEEWNALDQQYTEQSKASEDQQVISAKKGAKLMKLKKGAKKCKCGCDMITAKADGGKLVSKCACGCDVKKKEKGGEINKKIDRVKVAINKKQTGGDINQPNKVVAKKGAKLKPKMQTGGKYNESEHATLIEKYRNKKTSTPELRRLQELNRISGHHDDGWEPKKAKPEAKKPEPTKKPKTEPAKKPTDRIGKHKLGGSIIKKFLPGGSITSYDYDWSQSMFNRVGTKAPSTVANPKANPSYAAQVFSPSYINKGFFPVTTAPSPRTIVPAAPVTSSITTPTQITPSIPSTPAKTSAPTVSQPKSSYNTNTLWGWMKSTGYGDASFGGRRDLWNKFYGSGTTGAQAYTGTADQNAKLLDALKKANTMGVSTEKAANLTNLTPLKAPSIKANVPKKPEVNKPEVKKPETKK